MRKVLPLFFIAIISLTHAQATRVSGTITNTKGQPLPYASVQIKGLQGGTTANNAGQYFLELDAGKYTIVVQFVGYAKQEKAITVGDKPQQLDFQMTEQQLSLAGVTVKAGGEDPAYEIIRHAIKKRKEYLNAVDSFTCEAYIKTLIKTRKIPNKIFGQKIDQKTDAKLPVFCR